MPRERMRFCRLSFKIVHEITEERTRGSVGPGVDEIFLKDHIVDILSRDYSVSVTNTRLLL